MQSAGMNSSVRGGARPGRPASEVSSLPRLRHHEVPIAGLLCFVLFLVQMEPSDPNLSRPQKITAVHTSLALCVPSTVLCLYLYESQEADTTVVLSQIRKPKRREAKPPAEVTGLESGRGGCVPRQVPHLLLPSAPLGSWLSSAEQLPRPLRPAAGVDLHRLVQYSLSGSSQFYNSPGCPGAQSPATEHPFIQQTCTESLPGPKHQAGHRESRASSISPGNSKLPVGGVMSSSLPRATAPLRPTQTLSPSSPLALRAFPLPEGGFNCSPSPPLLHESRNFVLHTWNLLGS